MRNLIKQGAILFAAGFVVMAGMRAAEWTIKRPPAHLMVCFIEGKTDKPACSKFEEIEKGVRG